MSTGLNPFQKHQGPSVGETIPALDFPKRYIFNRSLQSGSEGYVEQWTHTPSATVVAVKVIDYTGSIPNEVKLLRDLPPQKFIVGYLGYYEKQPAADEASILLEFCPWGDLWTVRSSMQAHEKPPFSEALLWSVYGQVMAALAFLHQGIDAQHAMGRDEWRPIVHRDVKLENVLVKRVGSGDNEADIEVKLTDFGMADYYDPSNPNPDRLLGTAINWSPEVTWESRRHTPAGDVWSAGSIIHELAHSFKPTVDPMLTRKKWFSSKNPAPYPENWPESSKHSYWASKSPRRVVPINLEPKQSLAILSDPDFGNDEDVMNLQKTRPCHKYSDELNECMCAGLTMSPDDRPNSGKLLRRIEEANVYFYFRNLFLGQEGEMSPGHDDDNEPDD
ncbi:kinase-like protein [Decorospora gaudefroyi]|uniref:Kinase-like protein n=1 Tax=Decorospora gaudefroyi TaxID=184978 RepID=A0A6A5KIF0_9PLEO|nr:kinase-like protein [Decorospora gaudefroyi]